MTTANKPNKIILLLQQYVEQVMLLSMECPEVHRTMLEMYHMVKSPVAFFQPNIAAKVLRRVWQKKTKPPLYLQDYEPSIAARG